MPGARQYKQITPTKTKIAVKKEGNNTAASTTQHSSPAGSRERKLAHIPLSGGKTRNVLSPVSSQHQGGVYPRTNNVAVYYQTAGVLVHESLISRAKDALDRVYALKADERAKKEKLLKDCERLSEVPPGNEENEGP